jgi:hypothetical protein
MPNRDYPLSATPKPTQDSTTFYKKEVKKATKNLADSYSSPTSYSRISVASNKLTAAGKNLERQSKKGKPGYDKMGFPKKP